MAQVLPVPEVLRCYFEETFDPQLPAMSLRWSGGRREQLWELPEGVTLVGPAPEQFGVRVQRVGRDAYCVRLLWDRTCFVWQSISRNQLLTSAIAPLLQSIGTDPWNLLDQPVQREVCAPCIAA